MPKKKSAAKRHPKRNPPASHHAKATTHRKRRSSKRPKHTNPAAVPAGMVLVRASDLTENPAKPKRRRITKHRHHPHKTNPAEGEEKTFEARRGVAAMAFGTAAAAAGLLGGAVIAKLEPHSKMANVAANLVGTALGGLVGTFNQPAGMIIAHNYAVAAGQWLMAPPGSTRPQAAPTSDGPPIVRARVATPARMLMPASRAMQGTEDTEGVIVADNMGEADVDGFERLEGVVVADNMGEADVDGFERLEGVVVADNMGGPDELEALDDFGDDAELGDEGFIDPLGDVEG